SANKLGNLLESRLGLQLYQTKENRALVAYIFRLKPIQRLQVSSFVDTDNSLEIPVYGDFKVNLKDNFSMLVSGASGAGKSYFTYYYLIRFLAQTVGQNHARIMAIDPKQSDLYKLCKVSGMPAEDFGTTNAEAFAILKRFTAEMNRRMQVYADSQAFNSVAIDLGLPPYLLVIEEYSSLVAGMDAKAKKDFENQLAVVVQKGRQLSMGALMVMQQPRSDSISTNVREQLQNAVFLGQPTKEAAGMMFGTSDVPTVSGVGAGLFSIERSNPQEFKSPMFSGDVFNTILPVWKKVMATYPVTDETALEA
ncbi:FtsK/SpoIIIE domain-containing protein, partial [Liquorilactobacillus satsumensis]|uniref:FtsK/SpoIIIE domain-containing protein n=1 Tax=Liquorilactobacillus satsumensis TaxID=259059 RepID=UPI0039E84188